MHNTGELRRDLWKGALAAVFLVAGCGGATEPSGSVARAAEEPLEGQTLVRLRRQIGARTVSRLVEICDDPIPIMGPDLRMAAQGA